MFIVCSFISNSPKLETNQMKVHQHVNEQTFIYPYNVALLSNEKEHHIYTLNNMDESQNNYTG